MAMAMVVGGHSRQMQCRIQLQRAVQDEDKDKDEDEDEDEAAAAAATMGRGGQTCTYRSCSAATSSPQSTIRDSDASRV
jgi:hypothetical protein